MATKSVKNDRAIAESVEAVEVIEAPSVEAPSADAGEAVDAPSALSLALTGAGEALAEIAEGRATGALGMLEALTALTDAYADSKRPATGDALAKAVAAEAVAIRAKRIHADEATAPSAGELEAAKSGLTVATVKVYLSAGKLLALGNVPATTRSARLAYYIATGGMLKVARDLMGADNYPEALSDEARLTQFEITYLEALSGKQAASVKAERVGADEVDADAVSAGKSGEVAETILDLKVEADALSMLATVLRRSVSMTAEGRSEARRLIAEALTRFDAVDASMLEAVDRESIAGEAVDAVDVDPVAILEALKQKVIADALTASV